MKPPPTNAAQAEKPNLQDHLLNAFVGFWMLCLHVVSAVGLLSQVDDDYFDWLNDPYFGMGPMPADKFWHYILVNHVLPLGSIFLISYMAITWVHIPRLVRKPSTINRVAFNFEILFLAAACIVVVAHILHPFP